MGAQPEKLSHFCGFCGKDSWFWEVTNAEHSGSQPKRSAYRFVEDTEDIYAALYRCGGCEKCSIVYFILTDEGKFRLELVLPNTREKENEWLPAAMEADRQEAWNCYHDGLHRAAILMARTTLQRATRHLHDFENKRTTLESELDTLVAESIINQDLRDNADEVRITGNDVAHPSEMGEVTSEDAHDSLVFLEGFLEATISIPERRKKRKALREHKDS